MKSEGKFISKDDKRSHRKCVKILSFFETGHPNNSAHFLSFVNSTISALNFKTFSKKCTSLTKSFSKYPVKDNSGKTTKSASADLLS